MKHLYAPWRGNYITNKVRKEHGIEPKVNCVFCKSIADTNDEQNFILRRFKHNIIILNLFPYNTGHLMVIPIEHKPYPNNISKAARNEMMELTSKSAVILQDRIGAEGVNIGMNLGHAAGAGIPSHMHMHVLPRWIGDTNFMPLLAETKPISLDLKMIYKDLKPLFENI